MFRDYLVSTMAVMTLATCLLKGAPSGAQEELVGFWEWDHTYGGVAGVWTDPTTVGHTRQLELLADGTARSFRDEILHETGTWDYGSRVTLLDLSDFPIQEGAPDHILRDEVWYLTFREPCCDLFEFHFHQRGGIVAALDTTFGSVKALYR